MFATTIKKAPSMKRLLPVSLAALAVLASATAQAAAPGIAGNTINLTAQPAYISQPDGNSVYSWGYGCTTPPATTAFVPTMANVTPF